MKLRLAVLGVLWAACSGRAGDPAVPRAEVAPPVAAVRPHEVVSPHGTRVDPYYWLRDDTRSDPEVLAYLTAENRYTQAVLAPTGGLREQLYREIVARIVEDDSTVPYEHRGAWYYERYEKGMEHPVYARRTGSPDAPEEILHDASAAAREHPYYEVGDYEVSPDGRYLAIAEDIVGRYHHRLRVKDLATGQMLPDTAEMLSGSMAWARGAPVLLYAVEHPVTLRSYRVYRHTLGEPTDRDVLVYEETDPAFSVSVGVTKSEQFLYLYSYSTVSSEQAIIHADAPAEPPRVLIPRERDHEYAADHVAGRWIIHTNWQAKQFRLVEAEAGRWAERDRWRDIVPHRDDRLIADYAAYRDFIAVSERSGGLRRVRVVPWSGGDGTVLEPVGTDSAFTMDAIDLPGEDRAALRFAYTSMTTPKSIYEHDVASGTRRLLKQDRVLGDFDPSRYVTRLLWAPARDGARVPVSVVHRADTPIDGTAPLVVYGYGAYGLSRDPTFTSHRLTLLDRGWVYAIAHVRGGQELGRPWYEDGKLLRKTNSFTDFIDATEHLLAERYGARGQVFAMGGSAGGLLMGAVVNLRPELYRGVIAWVPFVDVVTTMLDDDIPLTTSEFDEWGNPDDATYYDYMLSYSPYDNVRATGYPAMLVTTGLHDSQVQYFEPAKWVARLRATRTDDNPLLLHIDMDAGHGGKSGRYQTYRERARDYAFLLWVRDQPDARR